MTAPRLTREQAAIIAAYTGVCCGPFEDVQRYADKVLGIVSFTHHFADKKLWADLKAASKDDFIAIAAELGDDAWR